MIIGLGGLGRGASAQSNDLIVDISQHLVAITTGFTGADVLLFGVTEGGEDVIVVVRGPDMPTIVRRKERVAGIWVNEDELVFTQVPALYHVAASGELAGKDVREVLRMFDLGAEILRPDPAGTMVDPAELQAFREALIRNKQRVGLYAERVWPVTFIGERLFRTTIRFPANVPTGTYSITVFSIENGRIKNMTTTPLVVSKAGFGAAVYEFAHEYAAVYGVIAILVALVAGWLAGVIFRKA